MVSPKNLGNRNARSGYCNNGGGDLWLFFITGYVYSIEQPMMYYKKCPSLLENSLVSHKFRHYRRAAPCHVRSCMIFCLTCLPGLYAMRERERVCTFILLFVLFFFCRSHFSYEQGDTPNIDIAHFLPSSSILGLVSTLLLHLS
jgi:hypothetical protein